MSVGLGAGDGKATGGGPIRNATSRNLTGLLDSAGAPQWDEEQLAEYVATGAIKMLGPSDPAVMAYLAANRKV